MKPRPGYTFIEVPESVAADLAQQLGNALADTSANHKPLSACKRSPLTTKEAAETIGMSEEYVRDHALELHGTKRGNKWVFDPAKLEAAAVPQQEPESTTAPRRRRPAPETDLLPVNGDRV